MRWDDEGHGSSLILVTTDRLRVVSDSSEVCHKIMVSFNKEPSTFKNAMKPANLEKAVGSTLRLWG